MNNQGWIKLHRKLSEKCWSNKPNFITLWIHLLLNANHKSKEFIWNNKIIIIKPGQFITGRDKLAKITGINRSTIDRILTSFEREHQIEQQKTNKFRLITIVNWEEYQQNEPQNEQQVSNKRATSEHKQEYNNDNNDNNNNIYSELSSQINDIFKIFYDTINRNINFGNKTQRKAVEDMIRLQGFEKVKKVAEFACKAHGQKYAPIITTPSQLKDKWSALEAWAKNKKEESTKSITII